MTLTFVFILFSGVMLLSDVYAQEPLTKLGRGISNATLGFLELPMNIQSVGKESGIGPAISYGLLKGAGRAILRTFLGIYETATFWIPIPDNFEPILTNPEFIFEKEE